MNKNLCEIPLVINGKEHIVVYTIGALGKYETAFKEKEIFDLTAKELIESIIFGLEKHHPEIKYDDLANSDLNKEALQKILFEGTLKANFGAEEGQKRYDNFMKAIDGVVEVMQEDEEPKKK